MERIFATYYIETPYEPERAAAVLAGEQPSGSAFTGPTFGIAGCRQLTQVMNRLLIDTIVNPSIGLTPVETADTVNTLHAKIQ